MFGLFNRKKDYDAVINAQTTITVRAGQNLLEAGLDAGLNWPHDCRVGSCGTCRCRLKKGRVRRLTDFTYVLTDEELDRGMILACQSQLKSEVDVEVEMEEDISRAAVTVCQATLTRIRNLTHDILELTVNCNSPMPEGMLAGQYAEISYEGLSKPRSYSFAKAPGNGKLSELSFFVRHVPGGEFTDWLFKTDRTGAGLQIKGPYGDFRLHEGEGPMICVAGGSGISAIKAMLEHACNLNVARDAYFLFGARTQRDLYCRDEMQGLKERWNKAHTFEFFEVLSEEPKDSDWSGPRGFVTEHLKTACFDSGQVDARRCQAYLCGPPPMIDAAIVLLEKTGFSEGRIFYDKFLDASTIPGGR